MSLPLVRAGTNRILNPSFETNTYGWSVRAGSTAERSTEQAWSGSASFKITPNSTLTNQGAYITFAPDSVGVPATGLAHLVTSKVRVWIPSGQIVPRIQHQVNYVDGSYYESPLLDVAGTGAWQELTLPKFATDPGKTIQSFYIQILQNEANPATGAWMCYLDGVDLRIDEPDVDTYIDGDQPGCAWSGTPHNSLSTRARTLPPATGSGTRGGFNRMENPSAEVSVAGWGASDCTLTRDPTKAFVGAAAFRINGAGPTPYAVIGANINGIVATGVPHLVVLKVRLWIPAGTTGTHRVQVNITYADATVFAPTTPVTAADSWQEVTVTGASDPTKTITSIAVYALISSNPVIVAWFDGVDLRIDEPANSNETYLDGDQGPGYGWTGTPHASSSLRLPVLVPLQAPVYLSGGKNWVTNPSVEVNTTDITLNYQGSACLRTTEDGRIGAYCLKVVTHPTTANSGVYWALPLTGITLTGVAHLISARISFRVPSGTSGLFFQLYVGYTDATAVTSSFALNGVSSFSWQTVTRWVITDPAKTINSIRAFIYVTPAKTLVLYLDAVDVRIDEPVSDAYFDGSFGGVYSWTAAAENSTSVRAPVLALPSIPVIPRGGTNRIANPSFEVNTANWSASGGGAISRTLDQAWSGTASLKLVAPTSAAAASTTLDLTGVALTGVTHSVTARLRVLIYASGHIDRVALIAAYSGQPSVETSVSGLAAVPGVSGYVWQEVVLPPLTTDSTLTLTSLTLTVTTVSDTISTAAVVLIDGVDARIDEFDDPSYIDGSLGARYSWAGTAHASISTRSAVFEPYVPAPSSRGGTNRIPNPSAETNVSGWAAQSTVLLRVTEQAFVGGASFKLLLPASGGAITYSGADLTGITTTGVPHVITARIRVLIPDGAVLNRFGIEISYSSGPNDGVFIDATPGTGAWVTLATPPYAVDPAKTLTGATIILGNYFDRGASFFYFDGVDLRIDEPDTDDYIDGSLGPRYAWSGAAHGSISTRSGIPQPEPVDPSAIRSAKNWLANPSVETNLAGWITQANAVLTQTMEAAVFGTTSAKVVSTGEASSQALYQLDLTGLTLTGVAHTIRIRARIWLTSSFAVPTAPFIYLSYTSGAPIAEGGRGVVGTGAWQIVEYAVTTDPARTITGISIYPLALDLPASAAFVYYFDAIDVRIDEADVDSFVDGSLGPRYAWTATAHASPSLRGAVPLPVAVVARTGPLTLKGEVFIATKNNDLVEDISALLVSGKVTWDSARSTDSGGTPLSADFVIREPDKLRPYQDYLAPFVGITYGNGEVVRRQLGLFALDLPLIDYWPSQSQATIRGKDLTWLLRQSVLANTYNVPSGANFDAYLRALCGQVGVARTNIRASNRTSAYNRSFLPGQSRLEVFNKLANGIGWYSAFMQTDGRIASFPYRDFTKTTPSAVYDGENVIGVVRATPVTTGVGNVAVVIKDNASKAPIVVTERNTNTRSPISIPNLDGQEVLIEGRPIRNSDLENEADARAYARYRIQTAASYVVTVRVNVVPDLAQGMYQTVELDLYSGDDDLSGVYWLKAWTIGLTAADGPTSLDLSRVVVFEEELG